MSFSDRLPRAMGLFSRGFSVFCLVASFLTATILSSSSSRSHDEGLADLVETLMPSVVNISTSTTRSFRGGPRSFEDLPYDSPFREFFEEFYGRNWGGGRRPPPRSTSLGSGFVIDSDGIIVTNHHVVAGADEIVATFHDGSKLPAEVVGSDAAIDIAVIRVSPESSLSSVSFGDSDSVRPGDRVIAIGNPFGLGGTVTSGIVSARNRDINAGSYDDFIQTDAAINRGNSGGPLFNSSGEVIGVNTAIISPSGGSIGLGFSVPSSSAVEIIDQLINFGEARRGWLGVRIQSVSEDIAASLGLDEPKGALVSEVISGSPAAKAGLQPGDVILSFGGEAVSAMRDLPKIVAGSKIGGEAEIEILRQGSRTTLRASVGRLTEESLSSGGSSLGSSGSSDSESLVEESLGLRLSRITGRIRDLYDLSDSLREGAVVESVLSEGSAAEKRIAPGDVIIEAGQRDVSSPSDVSAALSDHIDRGLTAILLRLSSRGGDARYVALRIRRVGEDGGDVDEDR